MNIPARYANGFLGDIGVPPDPAPMDYNAWFEVFLDGRSGYGTLEGYLKVVDASVRCHFGGVCVTFRAIGSWEGQQARAQ